MVADFESFEPWVLGVSYAALLVVGWGVLNPVTFAAAVLVNRRRRAWAAAAPLRRGALLALLFAVARVGFGALVYALCHVLPLLYGAFVLVPDLLAGYSVLSSLRWEFGPQVPAAFAHLAGCGVSGVMIALATLPLFVGAAFWAARLQMAVRR